MSRNSNAWWAWALLALLADVAVAQEYPAKPVRLVVGFPPGGANDIIARLVVPKLSETLGAQFIVENRPGANAIIGTDHVAKAAPDGYTLYMSTSGIQAINPVLYSKMPADPNKELAPISALVSLNNVLVLQKIFLLHHRYWL